jgi:uncharacterized protein (DUF58 family)
MGKSLPGRWRPWLAGFTTRACCLLAAGGTAAICGLLLGETDLVRAGGFAVAVPLVASIVVRRSQVNIASRRSVDPVRASAGSAVTVSLTVTNRSLLPTGTLMMEDGLPSQLHGRARFVLDGLGRRESRAVTYRIPPLSRGRHEVGPLRLRLTDPFRMVDLNRSFTTTSTFVLTPIVDPLPGLPLPRSWDTGENLGSHSIGSHGADDASTREYRRGDDLRKIHWRSTAKTGALMVRHEERPWQGHTVVLLDTRFRAHQQSYGTPANRTDSTGPAATADTRDADSLEWAISTAASVTAHLLGHQRDVSLIAGAGGARHSSADTAIMLDALAGIEASTDRDLTTLTGPLRDAGREATLIAVLGRLDAASLRMMTQIHPRGSVAPAFAVLLDVASWQDPPSTDPALDNAAATLQAAGWSVTRARRGDRAPAVWSALVGQRAYSSSAISSLGVAGVVAGPAIDGASVGGQS